jgi:pimeloyl-ACP methyl ester carboxylesterase
MSKNIYKVKSGEDILKNYLYNPPTKLRGILLFCHGFPGTNRLPKLAHRMYDSGIMLVEINYSGDKETGGKFSFYKCIRNIESTSHELRRAYPGKKIVALGYSLGGLYLLNVVRKKPKLFDKIILANPVLEPAFLFESPLMLGLWKIAKRILALEKEQFYQSEIYSLLSQNNPFGFVNELAVPMEMVLSEKDEVISLTQAKELYSMYKKQAGLTKIQNAKHELNGDEKELVAALLR